MGTQADQEQCHRCGHRRAYHDPTCTFKSASEICTCIGFVKNENRDTESARRQAEQFINKAILELRDSFSSDEEIKKEMRQAVDRIMDETNGD